LELRPKRKFTYLYDFGDSWEHDITVSRIDPVGNNKELARPLCLEGERAGPLEDSGGVWGYENMLEILKNPDHEEYEDTREWAGNYDSEHFDPEEINASLKRSFNT
jgi:hypothetical protein